MRWGHKRYKKTSRLTIGPRMAVGTDHAAGVPRKRHSFSPVTAVLETAPVETALATETAETPFMETSPTQTDVTSPGYALEKPRLVVQLPDSSIVFITLVGQQTFIAAEAPKGLFASGFGVCGPAR